MTESFGFLVLAAGSSRRFGSAKLKATLPDTKLSVLEQTLTQLPTEYPIHVVSKPADQYLNDIMEKVSCSQGKAITSSGNQALSQGIAHSIACGVEATAHWQGWVICLADMPWITTATYKHIIQALAHHSIVAPYTQSAAIQSAKELVKGNPVGFGKKYYQDLIKLSGDQGARAIVANNSKDVYKLAVKDPGILLDIDYPSDIKPLN